MTKVYTLRYSIRRDTAAAPAETKYFKQEQARDDAAFKLRVHGYVLVVGEMTIPESSVPSIKFEDADVARND